MENTIDEGGKELLQQKPQTKDRKKKGGEMEMGKTSNKTRKKTKATEN